MSVIKFYEDETKSGNAKVGIKGRGSEGEKLVSRLLKNKILDWGPGLILTSVGKANKNLAYLTETKARTISKDQRAWVGDLVDYLNDYYDQNETYPSQNKINKEIGPLPGYKKDSRSKSNSRSKSKSKSRSSTIIDSSDDEDDDRRRSGRGRSPGRRSRNDSEDDEPPKRNKSKGRSRNDSEDDEPPKRNKSKSRESSKSSRFRDDSEDDEPPKRNKSKRSPSPKRKAKRSPSPKRKAKRSPSPKPIIEDEVVDSVGAGDYVVESNYSDEADPSVQGAICDKIIKVGDEFTFVDIIKKTKIRDRVKIIYTFLGIVTHFDTKSHRTVTREGGDFFVGKSKISFVDDVSNKTYDIQDFTKEEQAKLDKYGFISSSVKHGNVVVHSFAVLLEGPIAVGKKARVYNGKVVDETITAIKLNPVEFPYEVTCKDTYTYNTEKGNFYPMRVHINNIIPARVNMGDYYSVFTESSIQFAYYLCIPNDYEYEMNKWGVISRLTKGEVSYPVFENYYFDDDEDIKIFTFNANSNVARGLLSDNEQSESYFKVGKDDLLEITKSDKGTYIKCVCTLPNTILKVGTKVTLDGEEIVIPPNYILPSGIPFKVGDLDYFDLIEKGEYDKNKVISSSSKVEEIEESVDSDSDEEGELEDVDESEENNDGFDIDTKDIQGVNSDNEDEDEEDDS